MQSVASRQTVQVQHDTTMLLLLVFSIYILHFSRHSVHVDPSVFLVLNLMQHQVLTTLHIKKTC